MQTVRILYLLNYRNKQQNYEGYVAKISCHMCGKEIEVRLGKTWDEKYNFI